MKKQNIALIDIGSNSIRLVIFGLDKQGFYKEVQNLKVVARLSSHFNKDGNITNKGITILLEALHHFQEITRTYNVTKTKCVATAAIRQAKNQPKIISAVTEATDFEIRVLSEYEEAFFGYLAVTNSTNIEDGLTIDIGGGSTEITLFKNRHLLHYHSFPFGAITLKQTFIKNELPTKQESTDLLLFLKEQFSSLKWLEQNNLPVIGIGGSARNLALISQARTDYPLGGLHQYEMSYGNIESITDDLKKLSFKQRQMVDGLSKDRADIIIPAAEAIFMFMEVSGANQFIVSNKGLRDGLFYEELFQQLQIDSFPNVAEESFYQLSQDYEVDIDNVKYISKLATQLYYEFFPHFKHKLTDINLRLLHLSCRVRYSGEHISYESSSQHTFYILTNLSIDGLTHIERLKIALIASFKSKKALLSYLAPYKEWFDGEAVEKLEMLGAILKFTDSLNITRQQSISNVRIVETNDTRITLKLTCLLDAHFEEIQTQKYKKHLEKSLKKRIELLFSR
ncbi:exopolyphosphatase [Bacillaceae bacterium IKA-2]|nr:exopolyphosphatase [Bacillaceae bacterium IKA-2]